MHPCAFQKVQKYFSREEKIKEEKPTCLGIITFTLYDKSHFQDMFSVNISCILLNNKERYCIYDDSLNSDRYLHCTDVRQNREKRVSGLQFFKIKCYHIS